MSRDVNTAGRYPGVWMLDRALRVAFGRAIRPGMAIASELIVLASMLLTMRWTAQAWGPEGLGEFVMARRTLGLLQLPLLCGTILGLSRSVAMARVQTSTRGAQAYLLAALAIVFVSSLFGIAILIVFSNACSLMLLGSSSATGTLLAVTACLPSLLIHGVLYGWFCGRRELALACTLQIVNQGMVPYALLAFSPAGSRDYFCSLAICWGVTTLSVLIWTVMRESRPARPIAECRQAAAILLRFGLPRVPADFLLGLFLALPTLLATHMGGNGEQALEQVGFLGIAVSMNTMLGAAFAPLGPIILPIASESFALGRVADLRGQLIRLVVFTSLAASLAALMLGTIAPWLIGWYFGEQFLPAVGIVRVTLIGSVPYCLYVILRSMLDGIREFPLNGKNILLATIALLAIAIALQSPDLLPVAFSGSLFVLGLATVFDGWRLTMASD